MLKHEDTPQTPLSPAAQVRVTPEELTAAITRLEAKKDAGQQNLEGTVAIGEVVQQLGLDATPEEVLAEVQAGQQQATPQKRQATVGRRLVLVLGLACILLGLTAEGNSLLQTRNHQAAKLVSVGGVTPAPIQLNPNLLVSTTTGSLITLSEVGDSQAVRCNLSEQNGQLAFYQWTPGTTTQASWTLVEHHGKAYVRGWTSGSSGEQAETEGLEVRSAPNGAYNIPITLPLEGFKATPYQDNGSEIRFRATEVHLDRHANEKW